MGPAPVIVDDICQSDDCVSRPEPIQHAAWALALTHGEPLCPP